MKRFTFLIVALLVFSSHDMYLKLDTYFLAPSTKSTIFLYNGTFEKSENVIDRDRMIDVSLVYGGTRSKLDTTQWSEKDSITILSFDTKEEGTYVAGVSTKARNIEMDAEAFNSYLEHDGVLDMLELRKSQGTLDDGAVEKYAKHVKAIFQVGNNKTDDWATNLGYPVEFIPLNNPYELHTGDEIKVKLLANGDPLPNQLVYADSRASIFGHTHDDHSHDAGHSHDHGDADQSHDHDHDGDHEHSHDEGEGHTHTSGLKLRTDRDGVVTVPLAKDGIYFLRTINLVLSEEEGLTHESNWATLTFEVGHDHSTAANHDHEHEEDLPFGVPSYVYWIGSLALVSVLFFIFYKRNDVGGEEK